MPSTPLSSISPTPPLSSPSSCSKHSDALPSPKKRKLNGVQSVSSTASTSTPDPQLDAARRAASHRILNIWSSLEQKYACRLDEDDIVDLRTASIIKDRGVLSSTNCAFGFGCFSEHDTKIDDTENEGTENEGEDELGGWGSDLELDQQFSQVCLPVRMRLDPADADDLEEFLVAERSRRKGDRARTSDDKDGREEDEEDYEDEEDEEKEDEEEEEEGEEEEEEAEAVGPENSSRTSESDDEDSTLARDVIAENSLIPSPDESEDELAGYDATVGEGAMLWEVERPPDYPQTKATEAVSSEITPLGSLPINVYSQTPQYFQLPRSRSPPPTSRRTSTSLTPAFKTPRKPSRCIPSTTLTPLTQRLSLKREESRATSVSPTKRLIPEVVLPKLKIARSRLKEDKQISNMPSPSEFATPQKARHANPLEKGSLKRKHSSVFDGMDSPPYQSQPVEVEEPVVVKKDGTLCPQQLNAEPRLNVGALKFSPDNRSQNILSSPFPTEDQIISSHLSVPSQEDKPQLPSTQSPAPQYMPVPPYAFPLMPPYPQYTSPDWSMHYRQNQVVPPSIYSTDPRFYLAQAMQSLSFLFNPAQIGNSQAPWHFPLPPPEMSHTVPTPSLSVPCPAPPDQKRLVDGPPSRTPTSDLSSFQLPVQKSCLKKVSFSPVSTSPYRSRLDSLKKSRTEQSSSMSRLRSGSSTIHDKRIKDQG